MYNDNNTDDDADPRVLVLGHSFIRRLDEAFIHGRPFIDMNLSDCAVQFHARGGASATDLLLRDVLPANSITHRYKPQVVVLQCGGNDLCSQEALAVRQAIMNLINELLAVDSVRQVVVLDIFKRLKPRYISAATYASRREELNTFLWARISMPDLCSRVISHQHRRLENSPLAIFHADGVHLSREVGMPKYWKVVRGAIMRGLQRL